MIRKRFGWSTSIVLALGLVVGHGYVAPQAYAGKAQGKKATHKSHKHVDHHAHLLFQEAHKTNYWSGQVKLVSSHALVRIEKKHAKAAESVHGKVVAPLSEKEKARGDVNKMVHYGVWTWFWKNGSKKTLETYCSNEQVHHGECHFGHRHGAVKSWYSNGNIRVSTHFVNGKESGKRTEYFENGKVRTEQLYKKGRKDGPLVAYWWNGKKSTEGGFAQGKKSGIWREWYDNGKLKRLRSFRNGQLQGRTELWWWLCRPSGCVHKKMSEGSWKGGKKHGFWRTWSLSQTKPREERWENGHIAD